MLRAGVAGLFLERDCWPGRRKNFDVRFIAAMVTSRCDGGEPPPGGELPFIDGEVVSGGGPIGSPMLDCTADSRAISPMAPCSTASSWPIGYDRSRSARGDVSGHYKVCYSPDWLRPSPLRRRPRLAAVLELVIAAVLLASILLAST